MGMDAKLRAAWTRLKSAGDALASLSICNAVHVVLSAADAPSTRAQAVVLGWTCFSQGIWGVTTMCRVMRDQYSVSFLEHRAVYFAGNIGDGDGG